VASPGAGHAEDGMLGCAVGIHIESQLFRQIRAIPRPACRTALLFLNMAAARQINLHQNSFCFASK
jgi:hypothetical protein